ncbi:iron-only hydrogenase maturation protein HydE [Peptoclostridium litorale DSM 5388]|uniref:Biotin synthase n=1 Tax=Peptoclostridium litorale DSM 5388 TaxID=1121324 RepID=A0A069RKP5_PEPLI|nr:[FeFe] hydrogenase H-cluster radical SAM maturase HydE [Peptoclostridium litorale]KDR96695.1 biotin synthase [Peptoclostridium litorale DSM 5388]SIN67650.1 iron-only hydrogenase maturation protein HydE [Peptoclostridium litorale DSM 5388]
MKTLLDKLYIENDLSERELALLLQNMDSESEKQLFEYSSMLKTKHYGKSVYMRGLIEFTNFCKQDCLYCGIRRSNSNAERYRLSKEEILRCCEEGHVLGYRTFVLQGGEDSHYDDSKIIDLIKLIKSNFPDSAVTLSIGEKSFESYKSYYDAGADRYLLRHETASKRLYEQLHPGMSFENRINCLKNLKKIGFQTGAGFMVGLPGQTNEDLAKDLVFLKEVKPEMVGIGPYIPHPNTPIGKNSGGSLEKTLIMLALARLLLPDVLLPSTTALGTIDPLGREKALNAGANVVMPNLSPTNMRKKYELYADKICTGDEAAHCRKCIEGRINRAGFEVDMSRGDHPSKQA